MGRSRILWVILLAVTAACSSHRHASQTYPCVAAATPLGIAIRNCSGQDFLTDERLLAIDDAFQEAATSLAVDHDIHNAALPEVTVESGEFYARARSRPGERAHWLWVGGLTSADGLHVRVAREVPHKDGSVSTWLGYLKWEFRNSLLLQNGYATEAY